MSKRAVAEFLKAKKVEKGKAVITDKHQNNNKSNNKSTYSDPKNNRIRVM